jgi:hypothetical protein
MFDQLSSSSGGPEHLEQQKSVYPWQQLACSLLPCTACCCVQPTVYCLLCTAYCVLPALYSLTREGILNGACA